MAGRDRVADRVEPHLDEVALAWLQLLGLLVAVPVGEVQEAPRDEGRRSVRPEVAQPDGDEGERLVRGHFEMGHREPEDLDRLGERLGVEAQGLAVLGALIRRGVDGPAEASPGARVWRPRPRHHGSSSSRSGPASPPRVPVPPRA